MKNIIMFVFVISAFLHSKPLSKEALEGKAYYLEANCQKCHTRDGKWAPKGADATDYKRLHFWVHSCNTHFSAMWFPEDEELVTKYLNEIAYHYKKPKK